MPVNQFEDSRITEGTLKKDEAHVDSTGKDSRAISRDDVRDGFEEPLETMEGDAIESEADRKKGLRVGQHSRNRPGDSERTRP